MVGRGLKNGVHFRVLPRFLARHLWHPWQVVEKSTFEGEPAAEGRKAERAAPIAEGTRARWRARLGSSGRRLVVVLAASGAAVLEQVAQRVGMEGSRRQLVEGFAALVVATAGGRLSALGALLHRLERGVRLM